MADQIQVHILDRHTLDRIERLEAAVADWLALADHSEWSTVSWQLARPDRDPRQIIAAYDPSSRLRGRYHHEGTALEWMRDCFSQSDYSRALAVEAALDEHGAVMVRWLREADSQTPTLSQTSTLLLTFLAERSRAAAELLLVRLRTVRFAARAILAPSETERRKEGRIRPKWDRPTRQLTIDDPDNPVLIAKREAPARFQLLDLLEKEGWPEDGILIPRDFVRSVKDTVDGLNSTVASTRLRFQRLDGATRRDTRVGWHLLSQLR